LAMSNTFADVVYKQLALTGIETPKSNRRGLHVLRHSLASNMLAEGVTLPVISEVLGHSDTDVTSCYIKVNIQQLRRCALSSEVGGVPR